MNLTALLDRCDDWINPIVVKELRQAVKSRVVVSILMLFLGLQLFLLGIFLLNSVATAGTGNYLNAGLRAFYIQQSILLPTIMIVVPAYAAVRFANERTDHNADLMFISTLRPISIIWGKFFAAVVLGLLVFSVCAPFMTFTYLLRGIDIPSILLILGIDLLAMCAAVMTGLTLAAIPGPRPMKFLINFAGFITIFSTCMWLIGGTLAMLEFGELAESILENWWLALAVTAGVLLWIGLQSMYAVAMISPASANRILPLRIYLLLSVIFSGLMLFLLSRAYSVTLADLGRILLVLWIGIVMPLLALQLVISVCERDHWGPRITRTIPRNPLGRLLAFLFYTGAAGGVTYSVGLAIAVLLFGMAWGETFAGSSSINLEHYEVLKFFTVLLLFTFCYCLSAVVLRFYMFDRQIRPGYTWVLGLLLAGLGSTLPMVVQLIIQFQRGQFGQQEFPWWALPNPIWAMAELESRYQRNSDFESVLFPFLMIWAILVAVLSMPWYFGQLRRFRPTRKAPTEPAPVLAVEPPPPLPSNIPEQQIDKGHYFSPNPDPSTLG
jgi:hypothetical protein